MDSELGIVAFRSDQLGFAGQNRSIDVTQDNVREGVFAICNFEGGAQRVGAQILRRGEPLAQEGELRRLHVGIASYGPIVMKQELDGVLDRSDQRKSFDLDSLERHVPGPHRHAHSRRAVDLADAEAEFSAHSRSGDGRSDQGAAESEQPSVRIAAGAVRDNSNVIRDLGAVGVAHGRVYAASTRQQIRDSACNESCMASIIGVPGRGTEIAAVFVCVTGRVMSGCVAVSR